MSAPVTDPLGRVALVTCNEVPDVDLDSQPLIPLLAGLGIEATPCVWDDRAIDWREFDLAVVRSCWDYHTRRDEFLAWAARVPRLANPFAVLDWNTDKRYLTDLRKRGIPVVHTRWIEPTDPFAPDELPLYDEFVIKPAVSLSSLSTGRYRLAETEHRRLAGEHVLRLQRAGMTVMLQPYMNRIEREGETSLVFIDGQFTHAVRKDPGLDGPDTGLDRRFVPHDGLGLRPIQPSAEQLALARRALRAVPGGPDALLYARVDLIPDARGAPVVLEVELTEPQLYLSVVPEAAARMAEAIASIVGSEELVLR